ncbi:HEPN domain-containing protein [Herbiconiux ginsengi]|uniref:HEPN domain-containing protein n=1 Tax=Herbiconiux ginsengi TaxID=381665 RepID=UPI000B844E40|nr:HEPN domain-containing protein [Herbiconiux ginsengi]
MPSPELRLAVRSKIAKAEEFFIMANYAFESGAFDAAVSMSVSASINASDAIILSHGGLISNAADHNRATRTLAGLDRAASRQLQRALSIKHKAQYSIQRCTQADATTGLALAERLLERSQSPHD